MTPAMASRGEKLSGLSMLTNTLSLSMPVRERIQAVVVVPMLEPMMTPMVWLSSMTPGVHQTHQHDRYRRGGLDGHGDAGAKQQALERIGGHALQNALQLAAGHLLQALGHGGHAVEEEGQTAAKGKDGKNIHAVAPFSSFGRRFLAKKI